MIEWEGRTRSQGYLRSGPRLLEVALYGRLCKGKPLYQYESLSWVTSAKTKESLKVFKVRASKYGDTKNEKSIIFGWLHKKGNGCSRLHLLSTQKHKDIGMGYKLQTRIYQLCDTNAAALAIVCTSSHVKQIEAFPRKSLTLFPWA